MIRKSVFLLLLPIFFNSQTASAQKSKYVSHPWIYPSIELNDTTTVPLLPKKNLTEYDESSKWALAISAKNLKFHIDTLSSPYFMGRHTGHIGDLKAARYVAGWFYQWKFPELGDTSYFDKVPLMEDSWKDFSLSVNDIKCTPNKEFYALLQTNKSLRDLSAFEVVFLGYGIDDKKYSDYKKKAKKLKDKVIVIYPGEPTDETGKSWISGKKKPSEWTTDWRKKLTTATKYGVKAVLIIDNKTRTFASENQWRLIQPYAHLDTDADVTGSKFGNSLYITQKLAEFFFEDSYEKVKNLKDKIDKTGSPQRLMYNGYHVFKLWKRFHETEAYNVLGYVEGTDLKNEVIIVSSHHDHLGKLSDTTYFPGANAATGTAAMLEIARVFNEAKKNGKGPRRSVLFVSYTGKEVAGAGVNNYADFPFKPMAQTKAVLDIDAIGRADTLHYTTDNNYVYLLNAEANPAIKDKIVEANKQLNITLDSFFDKENEPNKIFESSNAFLFKNNNVPCVLFYGGRNADDYLTTDTKEKIDLEQVERTTRLIFLSAWKLAN